MADWPPELDALKRDIKVTDNRNDVQLQVQLDAAVAFVERVHSGAYAFGDPFSPLPEPDADLVLGAVRLASRWYSRPRSPDGLVQAGDLGTSRIPTFDPDIDRMLKIGKYRKGVIA